MLQHRLLQHRFLRKAFLKTQESRSIFSDSIPNTGSMARDCLAAERTFLAWARTGLGFVGAGSALFAAWNERHADVSLPAAILMGNGSFLLLFATQRYLRVLKALQSNTFPLDTGATLMAIAMTAVGTIASLGLVVQAESQLSIEKTATNKKEGAISNTENED